MIFAEPCAGSRVFYENSDHIGNDGSVVTVAIQMNSLLARRIEWVIHRIYGEAWNDEGISRAQG